MPEFGFLPSWPLPPSPLLIFGALLLAGLLGGWMSSAGPGLPRITGYVLMGALLGPAGLGWVSEPMLDHARLFADVALGLVLFDLGRRLDVRWLVRERWLLATGVCESFASFGLTLVALRALGVDPLLASVSAAIAMAGSPAVLLMLTRELRAEGQVTERALNLVVINSALAFLVVNALLSYAHLEYRAGWLVSVLHPLYQILGSALLGGALAGAALLVARWIGKGPETQLTLLVAAVTATVGLAHELRLSVLIALLVLGIVVNNLDRRRALVPVEFGAAAQLFFVILFVFAGASLRFGELSGEWQMAAALVLARFAGKFLAILALSRANGISVRQGSLLGVSQLPMSALALALVHSSALVDPDFVARVGAVVLGAVAVLEILGPIAAHWALRRAGEAHPEAG